MLLVRYIQNNFVHAPSTPSPSQKQSRTFAPKKIVKLKFVFSVTFRYSGSVAGSVRALFRKVFFVDRDQEKSKTWQQADDFIVIAIWRKLIQSYSNVLILSDFRTYIYVRNSQTVATPVRIYTYTDFAIEIWGFNRRLTDTLRYHHTVHMRCSRASGLQLAAILQQVNQRKKSGVYPELSAVFGKFWKIAIVGRSSIHRLVWNTTAHYMDFLPWKWS